MALFREDAATAAEDNAVLRFYERLAHRALVLVHQEVQAQDLALIRRIVRLEAPAHVDVQVASATWPLLVGVASLVGVDTYLAPPRTPRPVQVQRSVLGMGVFIGKSTKIVDRATGEVFYGEVPAHSVVVAGSLPGKAFPNNEPGPGLYCAVIVKRVDERTRSKTSINELLRD
jgi:hypothetical protein